MNNSSITKVTPVGLLIALGIIYGDIGTSPLYTMSSIIGKNQVNLLLVYGGVSCIFWTLTLQTTIKYVIITLRADNKGEGGIFSLFALLKDKYPWLTIFAIIGGSALLADGIITPPISVSSAVEGLTILYPHIETLPIVIAIISALFAIQILGTEKVGKSFGPIMFLWFSMLGVLGIVPILSNPEVLSAVNPYYAYKMLTAYPKGFWILGSVFLCTTGAEALYSDMGHCGKGNVRVSWGFVKTCLLLNYFGQAAWLIESNNKTLTKNPFFAIMPDWFLIWGIAISTLATIIASQALITGSFTLISEAIRLNFWPKVRIAYLTNHRGQVYVPSINIFLWICCILVVLFFRKSSHMEAAYGLSITVAMLMTTVLLTFYLYLKNVWWPFIAIFLFIYLAIELSFLSANLLKFMHGGYVSVIITCLLISIMWIWMRASQIKNRLTDIVNLQSYIPKLKELSIDESIPKYGTHIIYMTNAGSPNEIESKIMYSILEQKPKRADIYWFIHVEITNEPYTTQYVVNVLAAEDIIHITFKLGFRIEQKIGIYLKEVITNMVENKEVDVISRYESLNKDHTIGDFTFVVLEKFISYENQLPLNEKIILGIHFFIKKFTNSERESFGIDANHLIIEKMPLVIRNSTKINLERVLG